MNSTPNQQFPEFPTNIIQGVAKDFVDLYAPIRETPEAFLWLSFITYFGNAISKYVRLDSCGSEPRFFGVAIGRSARTRKSTGQNTTRAVFAPLKAQRIVPGFASAEGMLKVLEKTDKPTIFHLDEINVLAAKTDIKGSLGVAAFNNLFEANDYEHPLVDGGFRVDNAYLSLIGASTLEDFTKTWSGKHQDTGFLNRLFLVVADVDADKRIPRPRDPDPALLQRLIDKLRATLDAVQVRGKTILTLDANAEHVWEQFYNVIGDGPEWDRIDTYAQRLMVVLAVLRGEASVTKPNVQSVIEAMQYEVAVRQAVTLVVAENPLAEMEALIRNALRNAPNHMLKKRDLQRATSAHRKGIEIFNRASQNMKREGELDTVPSGRSEIFKWVEEAPGEETDVVTSVITQAEDTLRGVNCLPKRELRAMSPNCHQAAGVLT